MNSEIRICQNCKKEFVIESEDFVFYEKIKVPPPTWCPECRAKRRFIWRNGRMFWKRKSDATGKDILAMFPPGTFKVYEHDYWWSDKWDAAQYARDYNFSHPFFGQLRELMYAVPWFHGSMLNVKDSDYCNHAVDLKNCYFCFDCGSDEDSAYLVGTMGTKNSFDLTSCVGCDASAHSFYCHTSYKVFYSVDCDDCNEVWFSKDCVGCSNCFGCVGLRNKSYYIFNKPYTKKAYYQEIEKFNLGSLRSLIDLKNQVRAQWLTFPVKFMHGRNNVDVSGEYLYHCKNVKNSFWVKESQDCRYLQSCTYSPNNDSYDLCIAGLGQERCYEGQGVGLRVADVRFSGFIYDGCYNLDYSLNCHSSSYLFGCVGLRNKQYCILNKQYTKDEYENLVPKIIVHMSEMPYKDSRGRVYMYGEYFPPEFSPFSYNETVAQDYLPMTKKKAEAEGFRWANTAEKSYAITKRPEDLPDHIHDVSESILKEIIACAHENKCDEQCRAAFRIIPMELEFYRTMNLPLSRLCSNCRHSERLRDQNPMRFWHRKCVCAGEKSENGVYTNQTKHFHGSSRCPNEFETSYAPNRPEIVYCEDCYQSEIV